MKQKAKQELTQNKATSVKLESKIKIFSCSFLEKMEMQSLH